MPAPAENSCPVGAQAGATHTIVAWVLAVLVSGLVIGILGGSAGSDTDEPIAIGTLGISLLAGWSVYLFAMWLASRNAGSGNPLRDFGVSFAPIDLLGLVFGVAAQLALVPAVYAPLRAIWPDVFSEQALTETAEDLVRRADGSALIGLSLAVVIGAPLVEELFYRGLLQRSLLTRYSQGVNRGAIWVVLGVAVLFALIHFRPVEYPGLFVAGLVFGVCAWWTGRLGMSIAAHVAFNAVGVALAVNATSLTPALGLG